MADIELIEFYISLPKDRGYGFLLSSALYSNNILLFCFPFSRNAGCCLSCFAGIWGIVHEHLLPPSFFFGFAYSLQVTGRPRHTTQRGFKRSRLYQHKPVLERAPSNTMAREESRGLHRIPRKPCQGTPFQKRVKLSRPIENHGVLLRPIEAH